MTDDIHDKRVIVEIPEMWFGMFVRWFASVPLVSVPSKYVIAVHRAFMCCEDSYQEFYGEQLDMFKESNDE